MFKLSMFELDQMKERITDKKCINNDYQNNFACDNCHTNCQGTCTFSRL